jgi:carbamoyl-phosphate synthase large subunit
MRVLITQPRNKEKLCKAFEEAGAELVTHFANADLVIPVVDEELPFFANNTEYLKSLGKTVMVGSENTVFHCRDKAEFNLFCRRHGFQTPRTWHMNCVVKPRFGKGSKGLMKFDHSFIVQETQFSPEVSVDYFADFEGNPVSVIPRYRLNVVNGESQDYKLVEGFDYDLIKRFGRELGLVGHNVIQGYWMASNVFIFGEVNPRFGGGSWMTFPLFNSPKWLVDNVK